ncbi:MAG: DNA recombination/repair protein RecA, partial [Firmicutes bacterium]|nr:DNA recombination/repair protein RecA [Bacillota bacterium]
MDDKKRKALDDVIAKIEKSFGKGAIMTLTANSRIATDVISTGCL